MKCPLKRKSFYGRQWVFKKLLHCVNAGNRNVAVLGEPGSGKTAICCEIAWPTTRSSCQHSLHSRLLACHFCSPLDMTSLSAKNFVRSLVHQLATSPLLPDYGKSLDGDWLDRLGSGRRDFDVDEAFEAFVIRPLAAMSNPLCRTSSSSSSNSSTSSHSCLFVMIDSLHDDCRCVENAATDSDPRSDGQDSRKPSRTIYDLVCRFSSRMPPWLTVLFTASRQCRCMAQRLAGGIRRVVLDDVRRSNVVADMKLYVSRRLDTAALASVVKPYSEAWSFLVQDLAGKSGGSILYLELVLDALADRFMHENELPSVPTGLNAFYLWMCQRLFPSDEFRTAVKPVLSTLIATRKPMKLKTVYHCVWTHDMTLRWQQFAQLIKYYNRVLWVDKTMCVLFHNSFAAWLQNIKLATKDYFCSPFIGHCCIAMWYSVNGARLSFEDTLEFLYHMNSINSALKLESSCLALWIKQCGSRVESDMAFAAPNGLLASDAEDIASLQKGMISAFGLVNSVIKEVDPDRDEQPESTITDAGDQLDFEEKNLAVDCNQSLIDNPALPKDVIATSGLATCVIEAEGSDPGQSETASADKRDGEEKGSVVKCHQSLLDSTSSGCVPCTERVLADLNLTENGRSNSEQEQVNPLLEAARHGRLEVCRLLIKAGFSPMRTNSEGWNAIRLAALNGHQAIIQLLLDNGSSADSCAEDGRTALRAAAWGGHEDCCRLLLKHGAAVEAQDAEGRTPLFAACYMGHKRAAEVLLKAGADVNHKDCDGRDALTVTVMCCAKSGGTQHKAIVDLLLASGATVTSQDTNQRTALHYAAREGLAGLCKTLLDHGADVDHVDTMGFSPLLAAASFGHRDVVQLLLHERACLDSIDGTGRTALLLASANGNCSLIKLLLEMGLDELHKDNNGWIALHHAAFEGHSDVCRLLCSQNAATVNEVDTEGRSALHLAVSEGHLDVVKALISYGANVNGASLDGRPMLFLAAMEENKAMCELLIDSGADTSSTDLEGRSVMHCLIAEKHNEVAKMMVSRRFCLHCSDASGRSPLHIACWVGNAEMAEELIEQEAAVDARDHDHRTPLMIAVWQSSLKVAELLLKHGSDPNAKCSEGATALSIAAQTGNLEMVKLLIGHGSNPAMVDNYGRTPAAVAEFCGHQDVLAYFQTLAQDSAHPGITLTSSSNTSVSKTSGYHSAGSTCTTEPSLSPFDQPNRSQNPFPYGSLTEAKALKADQNFSNLPSSNGSVVDELDGAVDEHFQFDLPEVTPTGAVEQQILSSPVRRHTSHCVVNGLSIDSKNSGIVPRSNDVVENSISRGGARSDSRCSMSLDRSNDIAGRFDFRRRNRIVTNPNFRRKVL